MSKDREDPIAPVEPSPPHADELDDEIFEQELAAQHAAFVSGLPFPPPRRPTPTGSA